MSEMEFDFSNTRDPGERGIIAKYRGRCPVCDQPIVAGEDRITFFAADINDYVHVGCDTGGQIVSDPMPHGMCMVCWQARAANGTCGCIS